MFIIINNNSNIHTYFNLYFSIPYGFYSYIWYSDLNTLWRIHPSLRGDSVNNERFWAAAQ
jgi:hypothetical protein